MGFHNPIPMKARIRRCFLLAYRVPAERVAALVPIPLRPITRDGWAFLNVVFAEMAHMRPAGFPRGLGVNYRHVGYRLQVQADTQDGAKEGLYFLRSECDHALLGWLGNRLTDFRFHRAAIDMEGAAVVHLRSCSERGTADVVVDVEGAPALSHGSPFTSLEEATQVLRYNPLGMAPAGHGHVALLDIQHGPWSLKGVNVRSESIPFASALGATFELAFELAPIAYAFQRGRVVKVQP